MRHAVMAVLALALLLGAEDLGAQERTEGYRVVRKVAVLGDTAKASVEVKAALAFLVQWADGRAPIVPVGLPPAGGPARLTHPPADNEPATTKTADLVLPVRGFTPDPAGLIVPNLRVKIGAREVSGRGLLVTRRVDGGKVAVVRVEIR